VKKDDCIGCETCIEECPVDTICMIDEKAEINMDNCIHCGICHDVCPENAIKHDSEKIPEEVKANVSMTKEFMDDCAKYLGNPEEKQKCLNRMIGHFNKDKIVAEKTLAELQKMKAEFLQK
jgi:formate hydrogenlyase subunit 6/NADH:ubiquinone oxidoreductase subunit I